MFVQQLVKDLKLSDHVHFLGQQDYIEHLLSCADLLLLPTEQESFGLVALEAHASSVPVVGSATGGLPEVVEDGETGFLLPVGEVAQMAEKSLLILSDPHLNARFRKQARERAVSCFEKELVLPQYEQLYEEVLQS